MVAISRLVKTLAVSCSLYAVLDVVQLGLAAADNMDGTRFGTPERCTVGQRFEPGPVMGGDSRQPTRAEFQARTLELLARNRRGAGPRFSTAGAFGISPSDSER